MIFKLSLEIFVRDYGFKNFLQRRLPFGTSKVFSNPDMSRIKLGIIRGEGLHDLGVAAGDRGDRKLAATLLDEALMVSANRVPARAPIRAQIAYTRGLLSLADGELGEAQDQLERAAEASSEGSVPDPAVIAAAQAWALAREGAHRFLEAARSLATAEEKLAESRGPHAAATAHVRFLRRSIEG